MRNVRVFFRGRPTAESVAGNERRYTFDVTAVHKGEGPARVTLRTALASDEIRLRFRAGSREVLLAGILRAADALDTMLHPRPYQADLDPALPPLILRSGRGTNFHPQAVESLLQIQGLE